VQSINVLLILFSLEKSQRDLITIWERILSEAQSFVVSVKTNVNGK
jgi:hypothetical protein